MQIAQSKTREQFPLSPKKIIKKTIKAVLIYAFLLFFIYICLSANKNFQINGSVFLIILLLISGLYYYYQRWYFAVYFYDLTENYVVIKKGPIAPKEITVPYERIQDIYVDQDIWDRFFGLYDVHISSATISSGLTAHIDGVDKAGAEGLRNILLEKLQKKTNG